MRQQAAAKMRAEAGRWTFDKLWTQWKAVNATKKGIVNDDNRYRVYLQTIRKQGTEGKSSTGRYPAQSENY